MLTSKKKKHFIIKCFEHFSEKQQQKNSSYFIFSGFFPNAFHCVTPHNFHILQTTSCTLPNAILMSYDIFGTLMTANKNGYRKHFYGLIIYFMPKHSLAFAKLTKITDKETCCCLRRAKSCVVFEFM